MTRRSLFSVLVGLMFLGFGSVNARAQSTIQEAIDRVKSIVDRDPIKQAELRAEEAKRIIVARVITTNPRGKDSPEHKQANDSLDSFRDGKSVKELAEWAWENRKGRCAEQVCLMKEILGAAGVTVTIGNSTKNHSFPLVNLAPDADLDNPWTWGPNAMSPDTWFESDTHPRGTTLRGPENFWKQFRFFDSGRGSVYEEGNTPDVSSRRLLIALSDIYNTAPEKYTNCLVPITLPDGTFLRLDYRIWMKNYFKIPEEHRKGLDQRPKEDTDLEKALAELAAIRRRRLLMDKNDAAEKHKLHGLLTDLEGRVSDKFNKCSEEAKTIFQKNLDEVRKMLLAMKTDASEGISDVPLDEVPDDIVKYTTEEKIFPVKAGQWLSTGFHLKRDEQFSISATGTVKAVYPDGFTREWGPGGYYFVGFMRYTLKAMVGDKLIEVGPSFSGTAPVDGELKLAITSTYEKFIPEDRVIQGSFKVTVTVVKSR